MGIYGRDTAEGMFRRHIAEMRDYAADLAKALGEDFPIVVRIRSCADECTEALDRLAKRRAERLSA